MDAWQDPFNSDDASQDGSCRKAKPHQRKILVSIAILVLVLAGLCVVYVVSWRDMLPLPQADVVAVSEVDVEQTVTPRASSTAVPSAESSEPSAVPAISVKQYRGENNTIRIVFEKIVDGLRPNMVYIGGFMFCPENGTLENAGSSMMLSGEGVVRLHAETTVPLSQAGKAYQCVFFYYSLTGDNSIISSSQTFVISRAALPYSILATDTLPLTNAPTPHPTPTPAPTEKNQVRLTGVDANEFSIEPYSKQFHLYPIELRFYYHQLSANEKRLFSLIYDGVSRFERKIDLSGGRFTMDEYHRVCSVITLDCPELIQYDITKSATCWTSRKDRTLQSIETVYRIDNPAKFESVYHQLLAKLDNIGTRDDFGLSQYDHELSIYRSIIECSHYDKDSEHCAYAYSPFLYGYAKCTGYSLAFSLACRYYGIQCASLTGNTIDNGIISPIGHQWNIVKINDAWYTADVTWDDPVIENRSDYPQSYFECYQYFNITDVEMYQGRFVNEELAKMWRLPQCMSTADSFYTQTRADMVVKGDWRAFLEQKLGDAIAGGLPSVELRFEYRDAFNAAMISLEDAISSWFNKRNAPYRYRYVYSPEACIIWIYGY